MLENEGKRFYNATLKVWGKQDFINLLLKNKWIYDPEVNRFLLDPFYENEINFLKKIRILDLRHEADIPGIIKEVKNASATHERPGPRMADNHPALRHGAADRRTHQENT